MQLNEIDSTENTPQQIIESQGQDEVDFDYDDPNQKFFNLAEVKALDLKATWLGNTNQLIHRYQSKLAELNKEKVIMKLGFQKFAENQSRFQISSLRKINFNIDKQVLYKEFMRRSRKVIERLHPSLLINIFSYVEANVFLVMAKMRRVSQIFNLIYLNENVAVFFSQKDFGNPSLTLCQQYVNFTETFLYYKEIKYTVLIPQNSIKQDLEDAVDFINEIYKKAFSLKSINFQYFDLINKFMKCHRVVLALQSLSFTDLAVTRKASIVAFSNYLAFNPSSRRKEEITKTKYLKMIELVSDEDYRDSLVINSKISNYLYEQYQYQFGVFIDTLRSACDLSQEPVFDLVVYHTHNDLRSFFVREVILEKWRIERSGVSLEFTSNLDKCIISYEVGGRLQIQPLSSQHMVTFNQKQQFGNCLIYHSQFYYVILIQVNSKEYFQ